MSQQRFARKLLTATSAVALAFAGTVLVSSPAAAAPLAANDEATLVAAINTANVDAALDVITLGADITLTGSLPAITEDLEIVGNTHTIDTDAAGYSVFHDTGAAANIDLTFTGVTVSGAFTANAIDTSFSNVTISNSVFDNAPVDITGSGVTVMVTFSTFDNAPAPFVDGFSANVDSTSHVTITDSSADSNGGEGFDLYLAGAGSTLAIARTSADSNGNEGFEIDVQDANSTVTITDSSANDNDDEGVEIDTHGANTTVTITRTTVTGNRDEGFDLNTTGINSTLTITESRADDSEDQGIEIDVDGAGSTVTLTGCHADDNGNAGIDIDADVGAPVTVTVTGSSADGNDNEGFAFLAIGAGNNITVGESSADGNSEEGFWADAQDGAAVTLSHVTASLNTDGGLGVYADTGTVTARDSDFTDTVDGYGVSVDPETGSTVTLERLTVTGNALGGISVRDFGAGNGSSVSVIDSTVAGNSGSGINIPVGTDLAIHVRGTTISGNTSSDGGGIFSELDSGSSLTITNSTISSNSAVVVGGVFVSGNSDSTSSVTITHSTITNNDSSDDGPGGFAVLAGDYTVGHTVIAGNSSNGPDAVGGAWDMDADGSATGAVSYSLVRVPTHGAITATTAGTGNLTGVDPMLGPLANNGGPTLTHLPLDGSPVIGAGNPAITGAPATDQRGQTRIVGTIDLGAVELQAALAATGVDAAPLIVGGGILLALGGVIVFLVARRRHTVR